MKTYNEFLKHNVSLEFLKETFYYKDGILYWKERPRHHFESDWSHKRFNLQKANTEAGILDKSGYKTTSFRINGKKFKTKVHRIIWYITHNEVPNVIDHIDRNKLNNNLDNLRNVSHWENRLNTENFKGTNFHKATGKWVAQYYEGKKRIHLGLFNSEWEAIQAYRAKALEHRGVDLNRQFVYQDIKKWFEIAKPNPTRQDVITQISCVIEEQAEFLTALGHPELGNSIMDIALKIRNNQIQITNENLPSVLDAIADIKVTAIGTAEMLGMDLEGALVEVNASNYSKFEDGKPLLDSNGKIMKGKNYFAPNLEKFV